MLGFALGVIVSYVLAGAYVYSIGKPLNVFLSADKQVTISAILGWPATVSRVMKVGVSTTRTP